VSNCFPASSAPIDRHPLTRPTAAGGCSTIVSSTPGTIENSGAIAGRAAMAIVDDGDARRTSAIAGSAITASPSQFGARMTRRFIVCYGPNDRVSGAYHA